jgi:hypothetical protein
MPTIFREGKWKITMYFLDHPPPHFHIVTSDREETQVRLSDLSVMAGRVPSPVLDGAVGWARTNLTVLERKWDELHP